MCLQCHSALTDDQIYTDLIDIDNVNFDTNIFGKMNSTSISHCVIASSGYNGTKVRELGIRILKKYNNWLLENPSMVLGERLSYDNNLKLIEKIESNFTNHRDLDHLVNYLNKNLD